MDNNLSIYIHFPFCAKKCTYCNFYSIEHNLELRSDWTTAITNEIQMYSNLLDQKNIKTVYIGGGSPNLLPCDSFVQIVEQLNQYINFDKLDEFTIEINPSNVNDKLLTKFRAEGVDRISMGCQSYSAKELSILGRVHSPGQIDDTLARLKKIGFPKINLDFIYGIPQQSFTAWQNNLTKTIETGVQHLSLYNLTLEPGTPLKNMIDKGRYLQTDEDLEWQMYKRAHDYLQTKGFEHYEISNWAQPGYQALHNQIYWDGGSYIGFGPAAHSYYDNFRRWNKPDLTSYLNNLKNECLPPLKREAIDGQKYRLERLFLSLRTESGIKLKDLADLYNIPENTLAKLLKNKLSDYIEKLIIFNRDFIKLSVKGWFLSDSLIVAISRILDNYK